MRCAKCRTILKGNAEEGGYCRVECLTCERTRKSCRICKDQQVDKCFKCQLKNSTNKLDLFFDHIERGKSVETCKDPSLLYEPNAKNPLVVCRNLVIDTKFILRNCLEKYLPTVSLETLQNCFDSPKYIDDKNEVTAIFWLPITTTGTFYNTGLIPPMNECILLSNYLENHFGIGKDFRAQIVGSKSLTKVEWLVKTFNFHKQESTKSPKSFGAIKATLTNCKILHYFLLEKATFPNVPINSMLAECKALVALLKNPENIPLRDHIEVIEIYLQHIEQEMSSATAAAQTPVSTSSNGNNNNKPSNANSNNPGYF